MSQGKCLVNRRGAHWQEGPDTNGKWLSGLGPKAYKDYGKKIESTIQGFGFRVAPIKLELHTHAGLSSSACEMPSWISSTTNLEVRLSKS